VAAQSAEKAVPENPLQLAKMMRGRFSPLLKSWMACAVLYALSGYQTCPAWGWMACESGEERRWRGWSGNTTRLSSTGRRQADAADLW
jgi:hypothetical protein